jgi:hypothetical protein
MVMAVLVAVFAPRALMAVVVAVASRAYTVAQRGVTTASAPRAQFPFHGTS